MNPTIKSSRKIFGPRHFQKKIYRLLPCDNKIGKRNEINFDKKGSFSYFLGEETKVTNLYKYPHFLKINLSLLPPSSPFLIDFISR